ncbi:Flp pilus assembly protein CpaB [Wenxinia marina]|uniref:Flp pilus assembly protein CpaB n=1 Tax=Wenxinia marina DSM 24838 TaxID=1123501 RepID=A0A0D0QAT4_9RHOB|nr:Flp pilus assembly protein CpaB [Wenxinia marina]KIQ69417.1 Flp pilus assembly protein CpaB [Wenxinia marina DSM 24838]GGL58166.1 hypothetical protein GCM10011392_10760 [Wenxinia marina]
MRLTSILIVLTGFGVAGASAYAARDYLNAQVEARTTAEDAATIGVLVAARDIDFGQPLESQNLTFIQWPREAAPAGVFTDISLLLPQNGQEPRRARRAIAQGELILASRVSEFGEKVTIVQSLSANHRAMAIRVDAETAVGGFVTPGDYVDVILTQGRDDGLRTVTILQNVRVIGVDQDANELNDDAQIAKTVTLEVTPADGQRLALAQQAGTLSLTLRNTTEEIADSPLELTRLSDILQELSPTPESASSPSITVRRANVVTEEDL